MAPMCLSESSKRIETLVFYVVLAISEQAQVIEVLGVMMEDWEQPELWVQLF